VRDPRDVAVSYSRHLGRPIDWVIGFMANPRAAAGGDGVKVHELLSSWSIHVASWTERKNKRLHIMRYEDMLEDPAASFGAMLRFLGSDPPEDRLDRAVRHSAFAALKAQEQEKGFAERPDGAQAFFHTGRAGGWREALTPAQAIRIERDHATEMRRFGY
jgi:hypothetical protein